MDPNAEIHQVTGPEAGIEEKPTIEEINNGIDIQKAEAAPYPQDVFGDEEGAEVKYKVLKWWYGFPVCPLSFRY